MIADPPHGPYTTDDLDALHDDGVHRALVNGWLVIDRRPGIAHDHAAKILERALDAAATTDVYVNGPLDIDTGPSIRVPDVVVVEGEAARAARARRPCSRR